MGARPGAAERWEREAAGGGLAERGGGGGTWSAWMSKMTTEVGPPRERGMLERIRAIVKAVATSPSDSTRSRVPVGKKGRTWHEGCRGWTSGRSLSIRESQLQQESRKEGSRAAGGRDCHPCCMPPGKAHQCEGCYVHPGERIDDGDLLKNASRVPEGREEADVAVPHAHGILHEEVREPVGECSGVKGIHGCTGGGGGGGGLSYLDTDELTGQELRWHMPRSV